ncbi:hypothetical protein J6590_011979 [Homalodisca vitripennis]|nr:hypothetical protein J6590_011979 [Homalodisca vitripennis]
MSGGNSPPGQMCDRDCLHSLLVLLKGENTIRGISGHKLADVAISWASPYSVGCMVQMWWVWLGTNQLGCTDTVQIHSLVPTAGSPKTVIVCNTGVVHRSRFIKVDEFFDSKVFIQVNISVHKSHRSQCASQGACGKSSMSIVSAFHHQTLDFSREVHALQEVVARGTLRSCHRSQDGDGRTAGGAAEAISMSLNRQCVVGLTYTFKTLIVIPPGRSVTQPRQSSHHTVQRRFESQWRSVSASISRNCAS